MAWENGILDVGQFISTGDMTNHQYKAVQFSTSVTDGFAIVGTLGARVGGVLQENSTAATAMALRVLGVTKLAAESSNVAIAPGTRLVANANAQGYPSTAAGQHLIGISLGTLSTGSSGIVPCLLTLGAIST
jgi:hypothetical protein